MLPDTAHGAGSEQREDAGALEDVCRRDASAWRSYLIGAAAVGPRQFSCMCPESDIASMSRLVQGYGLPGSGAPSLAPSSFTFCFLNVSDGTANGLGVFCVPCKCSAGQFFKPTRQHGVLVAMSALWALLGTCTAALVGNLD